MYRKDYQFTDMLFDIIIYNHKHIVPHLITHAFVGVTCFCIILTLFSMFENMREEKIFHRFTGRQIYHIMNFSDFWVRINTFIIVTCTISRLVCVLIDGCIFVA